MPVFLVTAPDGKKYKVAAPNGASQEEVAARVKAQHSAEKPKSQWQGFKEGIERAANNYGYLLRDPVTVASDQILNYLGKNRDQNSPTNVYKAAKAAIDRQTNQSRYRSGTLGKIAGDVVATLPVAVAGGGLPVSALGALQGGTLAEDLTNKLKTARDIVVAAGTAKATDVVSKKVINPVIKKVIGAIKGDNLTGAQKVITKALDGDSIASAGKNVTDAKALGLPYTLADANPKLRALAGSATRYSPDALASAEDPLMSRSLGQIDRVTGQIDNLAPITDLAKRATAIQRLANIKAGPLYRSAEMAGAAPYDQGLVDILNTPAGQSAMKQGFDIAANLGKPLGELSPEALSTGELQAMPSYDALQATKRGLDSIIESNRNAVTGALNTSDPKVQALNTVRARLLQKLGEMNPNYAAANKTYSNIIGLKTALDKGVDLTAPRVSPQTVTNVVSGMPEGQLQQLQRGYATKMAEDAANASLNRNPFDRVAGSAAQQAKLQTLFPEAANRFLRARQLEGDMARTAQEVLGGSPTSRRIAADAAMKNDIAGGLVENAAQAVSGGGFNPLPFLRAALQHYSQFGVGNSAQQRAQEVARILLTQNGGGELLSEATKQAARQQAIQQILRLAAPPASAAALSVTQPQ